jgi:hypothetical protein
MNAAHLHLAINHIPVIGLFFGIAFLLVALATRNRTIVKSALWIFFIIALLTIPVYLTGEPAEEMVGGMPGISQTLLHDHEDAAEKAYYVILFLGLLSLGGLWAARTRKHLSGLYLFAVLLIAIITAVMVAGAANQGGKIRHTEIESTRPALIDTDHNTGAETEDPES